MKIPTPSNGVKASTSSPTPISGVQQDTTDVNMLSNSDFNRAYPIDEDQNEEEKNVYDDRFYSNDSNKKR